jgi:hypothetical protein
VTFKPHPLAEMTDDEREAHILALGDQMRQAAAAGDTAEARRLLALEVAAIKARSPAQVWRMEDCYFSEQGALARRIAQVRVASGG